MKYKWIAGNEDGCWFIDFAFFGITLVEMPGPAPSVYEVTVTPVTGADNLCFRTARIHNKSLAEAKGIALLLGQQMLMEECAISTKLIDINDL